MKASYTREKIKAVNVGYEAKCDLLLCLTCSERFITDSLSQRCGLLLSVFSTPAFFVFHKQMKGVGLTEVECDEAEVGLLLNN